MKSNKKWKKIYATEFHDIATYHQEGFAPRRWVKKYGDVTFYILEMPSKQAYCVVIEENILTGSNGNLLFDTKKAAKKVINEIFDFWFTGGMANFKVIHFSDLHAIIRSIETNHGKDL